jgi:diphosphomevalonate decarboxylase
MKATAQAPANIAFIKYWGKADEQLRIPLNDSFSMNLDGAYSQTTVMFDAVLGADDIALLGGTFSEGEKARIQKTLAMVRDACGIAVYAKVVTKNTFPKGAGAASSASGFAALTVAAFAAAGKQLSEKELTIFARLGSGSACRSIPDGFVVWEKGTTSETSFAYSKYAHSYWDLCDVLVIVDRGMKKVSTTEGHTGVKTSPYWKARIAAVPDRMSRIFDAFDAKNFTQFGEVIEEEALDMHHIMQTQVPPLYYWSDKTDRVVEEVKIMRASGVPAYFTIDAGPNVHVLCESKDEELVVSTLEKISGVEQIIRNKPAGATVLVPNHLF